MKANFVSNPFAERGPIHDPELFFGRESELREIFARLTTMQSISVVGERRVGKSSLLYHIYQKGPEELADGFTIAYVDLQLVKDETDFYRRLLAELKAKGDTPKDLERFIQDKQAIACLDEFEAVTGNPAFGAEFFRFLRGLMSTGHLALVTATQHSLVELTQEGAIATSPFFNLFSKTSIGSLTEGEAKIMMSTLSQSGGHPFSAEEMAFALREAGPHPYRLQVLCWHLFEAKLSGTVDLAAVRRGYRAEIEPPAARPIPPRKAKPGDNTALVSLLVFLTGLVGFFSVATSNLWGVSTAMGLALLTLLWILFGDRLVSWRR
jgi:hypothetical protein